MTKQPILVILMGVREGWSPIGWFREMKKKVPKLRVLAMAIPTLTRPETVKEWAGEKRAKIGLYGWHGTTHECFGWVELEAYAKLRDAMERGKWRYDPFFYAPNVNLTDEALDMLVATGIVLVGHGSPLMDIRRANAPILPFGTPREPQWPLGVLVTKGTNLDELGEKLVTAANEGCDWADPPFCVETTPGVEEPIEEVQP
jgi:hypothetical protein